MPTQSASFGSIVGISSIRYTNRKGILPGVGEIECDPQAIAAGLGTANLQADSVEIILPDCKITQVSSSTVRVAMEIRFADRRWRWACGHIDGHYNIPLADETFENTKNDRELMVLCLDAMGETGYDVALVPETGNTEVQWRGTNPAKALQELCERLGYEINYRHTVEVSDTPEAGSDTVKIERTGTGASLPSDGSEYSLSFSSQQNALCEFLRVICRNIRYEVMFELEPVGLETDGTIKHIDDLSYKPAGGWATEGSIAAVSGDYTENGKTVPRQKLAERCIYKWYRILSPTEDTTGTTAWATGTPYVVDNIRLVGRTRFKCIQDHESGTTFQEDRDKWALAGNWAPPGYTGTADDIDKMKRVLPLIGELNTEKVSDDDGTKRPERAAVFGIWSHRNGDATETPDGTKFEGNFQLDKDRGIVQFNRNMFRYIAGVISPAELRLKCVVEVTEPTVEVKQYYGYTVAAGGSSGVRNIQGDQLIPKFFASYNGLGDPTSSNNLTTINAQANALAQAEILRMTPRNGAVVHYDYLKTFYLDGQRRWITFQVSESEPPFTQASINTEPSVYHPDLDEIAKQFASEVRNDRKQVELDQNLAKFAGGGVVIP